VVFDDGLEGRVSQRPAEQCGDVLVRDRLGNWTYQWAASVDDWRQDVSLVVRGTDLLASTGRQIRLAEFAGRAVPARFVHHPLVLESPTRKLSKSDGDTGVSDLRAAGWTAGRVLGEAAALVGLRQGGGELAPGDLGGLFAR
jgi:glutamyl-tRNA synthetase/glutamyl-Q tRNA(Asp) synthetase